MQTQRQTASIGNVGTGGSRGASAYYRKQFAQQEAADAAKRRSAFGQGNQPNAGVMPVQPPPQAPMVTQPPVTPRSGGQAGGGVYNPNTGPTSSFQTNTQPVNTGTDPLGRTLQRQAIGGTAPQQNYQQPLMQGQMMAQPQQQQAGSALGGSASNMGNMLRNRQMLQQQLQQRQGQQTMPQTGKYAPPSSTPGTRAGTMGPMPQKQQLPNQYSYQPQTGQRAGFQQQMANASQQRQAAGARGYNAGSSTVMPQQPNTGAGVMNANSSIQPQNVYGQPFMQQAQNMALAQGVPAMGDLRAQVARPGLSLRGGAQQANIGQMYGNSVMQGANNAASLAQGMGFANANNQLQGQQARDQEAQQWAQLGAQGIQNQWNNRNTQQANLLNFLQSGYRGM